MQTKLNHWRVFKLPKKKQSYRLSESALQALDQYMKKWNLPKAQAIEHLLIRWRYLDDMGFREQTTPELECHKRIKHTDGLFYCVHRPPKMTLLETLQICAVCRKGKLGIVAAPETPAETRVERSSMRNSSFLSPENSATQESVRDPATPHEGQKWCPDGGLWVFPKKCEMCKEQSFAKWDECR